VTRSSPSSSLSTELDEFNGRDLGEPKGKGELLRCQLVSPCLMSCNCSSAERRVDLLELSLRAGGRVECGVADREEGVDIDWERRWSLRDAMEAERSAIQILHGPISMERSAHG